MINKLCCLPKEIQDVSKKQDYVFSMVVYYISQLLLHLCCQMWLFVHPSQATVDHKDRKGKEKDISRRGKFLYLLICEDLRSGLTPHSM